MHSHSSSTTDANKESDDETEGAGTTKRRWTQRRRHYKEGKEGRIGKLRALLSGDGRRGATSLVATIDQHRERFSEVFHGCIARAVPKLRRASTNGSVIHRDIGIKVTVGTNGLHDTQGHRHQEKVLYGRDYYYTILLTKAFHKGDGRRLILTACIASR